MGEENSPIDLLVGLLTGWFASRAFHVAAELGIADHLSDGPQSVSHLAAATESHPRSLYRLLRMLASYADVGLLWRLRRSLR
jgi:Dimerisation domain